MTTEPAAQTASPARAARQYGLEFVQLAVDVDADGLEGARGRVPPGLAPDHALDERGEFRRGADRRNGTGRDNGAGDPAGRTLFAVAPEHTGNLRFVGCIEPVGCRHAAPRIHPHVEGPVARKAKPAGRILELGRRDADIEQDAVHASVKAFRRKHVAQGRVGAMDDPETGVFCLELATSDATASGSRSRASRRPRRAELLENGA